MLLDPLIGGIAMGCIYSLIALGYNMLIRAMNLLHFAQGEVMMVGALAGVTLVSTLHIPYLAAIPLIMVICALLSLALDALEADTDLVQAIGPDLVAQFAAVKRGEWSRFSAAVTDWELKTYLPFL